jgi:hypothetical protein
MKRSQGTSPRIDRVGDDDQMSVDDYDAVYDYENYEDEYYDGIFIFHIKRLDFAPVIGIEFSHRSAPEPNLPKALSS